MDFYRLNRMLEISSVGEIPVHGSHGPRRSGGLEPDEGSHRIIPVAVPSKAVGLLLAFGGERPAMDVLGRLHDSGEEVVQVVYASNVEVASLRRLARAAAAAGSPELSRAAAQVIRGPEGAERINSRDLGEQRNGGLEMKGFSEWMENMFGYKAFSAPDRARTERDTLALRRGEAAARARSTGRPHAVVMMDSGEDDGGDPRSSRIYVVRPLDQVDDAEADAFDAKVVQIYHPDGSVE